jgi:hypothetical protein
LTPCLATRATMAVRTASDTSAFALFDGIACGAARGGAAGGSVDDTGARCILRAAFRVAVCGVATLADAGVDCAALRDFSTTDDSGKGKRLSLSVMTILA